MTDRYPVSIAEIAAWARQSGVTVAEARRRFAQYVVLSGIVGVPSLQAALVFKGGNALDFVWQPNRSTLDLDFSVDMDAVRFEVNIENIRNLLDRGLRIVSTRHGVALSINSIRQQPPGPGRTFVTYSVRVGYALPDQSQLRVRMSQGEISSQVMPVEISINEPIGDSTLIKIGDQLRPIRVCTIEDIVGEKLRALLQQPIRNRQRRQDVLDIAVAVRDQPGLNRDHVARFLIIKAQARDVPVSKAAFRNPEIAERARLDYAALESTTRTSFIPFEDAFALVMALVNDLAIPD